MWILWRYALSALLVAVFSVASRETCGADQSAAGLTLIAAQADTVPAAGSPDSVGVVGDHDETHGHDEAHGHVDPPGTPPLLQFDAGSAIVNIAIFIGVLTILSKLVWPVILEGLKSREEKIRGDLVSAHAANEDAKRMLAEYQAQLASASGQVQAMLAESRRDGELAGKRILEEAKVEAEQQRQRALGDIETAKKVAISELANRTSDMAILVAGKVLGRELKADDHSEMIRQSLERLPSNN